MKRGKLKRKSKSETRKVQDLLWQECRRITLNKYGNTCFTCGATGLVAGNCQLGHCIPSSTCGAFLRYDLRNLRIQCYHCNINCGGNGAIYYRNLVSEVGQQAVDEMFQDKQKIVKAIDHYKLLLEEYKLL
jgi:hypothetical protein